MLYISLSTSNINNNATNREPSPVALERFVNFLHIINSKHARYTQDGVLYEQMEELFDIP